MIMEDLKSRIDTKLVNKTNWRLRNKVDIYFQLTLNPLNANALQCTPFICLNPDDFTCQQGSSAA